MSASLSGKMEATGKLTFWTIGHSAAEPDEIVRLLSAQGIQVLVDVRSVPYSRFAPQANRDCLQSILPARGIRYLFQGDALGGRPRGATEDAVPAKPDYAVMEQAEEYRRGVAALKQLGAEARVCFMCSEEDPARCHRGLLISETLTRSGCAVLHIRHNGEVEPHAAMLHRRTGGQLSLF